MNCSLLALHRWLGLLAGIFLLLIGMSGSILVYSNSLERWLNPALYHIEPHGNGLPLDSMYNIVYRKYDENFGSLSLDMPASAEEVYEFTFTERLENYHAQARYIVDVDPYSGKILREGYCHEMSTSFIHWVMYFHDSFHYGNIGMLSVALVSITIFFSMITGLLIYGKSIADVLMFKVPLRRKSGMYFYRSLHLYIGVWALLFNIVVFFTGFWMVKATLTPGAWKLDKGGKKIHLSASLDRCLEKSREVLPGFTPDYIAIPLTQNEAIEIDGNIAGTSHLLWGDASRVMCDPQNGRVVEVHDITKAAFPENLAAAIWPLHVGNYGGDVIKILYVVGGLTPGLLSISGFVVWRKRKRI